MFVVLSFIAGFLLCIASWGSLIALCTGRYSLAIIGVLLFIGTLVLTFIVAAIYWIVDAITYRARKRLEIASTADEKHRMIMERDLAAEKWYNPFVEAAMVVIFIVGYGILSPIHLTLDAIEWLHEQTSELFSKTTA